LALLGSGWPVGRLPYSLLDTLKPHHVPQQLRRNPLFLLAVAVLVIVPPLFAFALPPLINLPDWQLLISGWLVALLAALLIDELWIREEEKVIGTERSHHISHRLVRNASFLLLLAVVILAPPPIAFYLPGVFSGSPDWIWLIVSWLVAL